MPINDPEKSENMRKSIRVYSGSSNRPLAQKIAEYLGVELSGLTLKQFANGEIYARYDETVRGADVFLIQSVAGGNVNDMLMELLIATDAAKRASARSITAVITHYGYARQDRKAGPREPITARLVANLLERAGVNRIITLDLHQGQIQGFFDIPVDNIYATPVLLNDLVERKYDDLMVVSPDVGGVVRARAMAKALEVDLAIIDKRRPRANVAEIMNIIGEVKGRTCVITDDIVDTAGTLCNAAGALKERGAKRVVAYITHPVLSGAAVERITNSALDELVVTDTIPLSAAAEACSKIRQVSCAAIIGETLSRIAREDSVSNLFTE